MMKFITTAAVSVFAVAAYSVPASAATITDTVTCEAEGGTMVNVKNSDYCLVPIRDAEYADEIYDGNQLGIVDCPGNKLNDGKYCMYPVTIRPAPATQASVVTDTITEAVAVDSVPDTAAEIVEDVVAVDE